MNDKEFKDFLLKFGINDVDSSRKIVEKDGNVYLGKGDERLEISDMFFIKLRKLLPTKYLLKFILENNGNVLNLNSEKRALDFTYGKNLFVDHVKQKVEDGEYYLLIFDNEILGYCEKSGKNLTNLMNIGEYLRE